LRITLLVGPHGRRRNAWLRECYREWDLSMHRPNPPWSVWCARICSAAGSSAAARFEGVPPGFRAATAPAPMTRGIFLAQGVFEVDCTVKGVGRRRGAGEASAGDAAGAGRRAQQSPSRLRSAAETPVRLLGVRRPSILRGHQKQSQPMHDDALPHGELSKALARPSC
jgi:hypothetical protein